MKFKRYFAVLFAVLLALGCLAGCGQSGAKQGSSESEGKASGQSAEASGENSAASEETATSSEETQGNKPVINEPVTLTVLCSRHTNVTSEASDIWIFHYLEWWLKEQGYDVTFDVQQTLDVSQQLSLLLGTDSLPDILFGIALSNSQTVTYGKEEGMVLDLAPYINEEYMPAFYGIAETMPGVLDSITLDNGGIYGLPCMDSRQYLTPTLSFGQMDRMYVNQTWLDQCNLEIPTNIDEFLDMLRAFKTQIKLESGEEVIPLLNNNGPNYLQKYFWMCLGYYGNDSCHKYGMSCMIKDDKIQMPVLTEDYRTFIEVMKTLYEEELVSPDFFTMDTTTLRGLSQEGRCGVCIDSTIHFVPDYHEWVEIPPFLMGDNDQIALSLTYSLSPCLMASADTKYPELVVMIMDFFYSPEGAMLYSYGPMQGQDPTGELDGWYWSDELNQPIVKEVEDGTYGDMGAWVYQNIQATEVGPGALGYPYAAQLAGKEIKYREVSITDSITGETITGFDDGRYDVDDAGGHWRRISLAAMEPYLTAVQLPPVYLSETDSVRIADMTTVLRTHIEAESAKFITGERPLSEIEAFQEELKGMDAEEYLKIYADAWAPYMDSVFNK